MIPLALLAILPLSVQAGVCGPDLSLNPLDAWMKLAVAPGPEQAAARKKAQELLKLDDMNFTYYLSLYQKKQKSGETLAVKLYPAADSRLVAYPLGTPAIPADLAAQFKAVDYATIKAEFEGRHARATVLLLKKMQAGTGSSMDRGNYFARRPEFGPGVKMGAKGTDLLVKIESPSAPGIFVEIPIAELQILQAIEIAQQGVYGGLLLQDIVGPETTKRLDQIWQKPSLSNPALKYADAFVKIRGAGRLNSIFQSHVPALNESGQISTNRMAPAGHGLFAVDALRAALRPELLPQTGDKALVAAIANGEDLNSLPDPVMIDWMVKNNVPVVLVTTSKTSIDKKGGILTVVKDQQTGEAFLKVLETAEAKAAGQLELFENSPGMASTNLTLFNYQVLRNKLKDFTDQELLEAMAPDLVLNWKEQKDSDGVKRKYLQLEGTMGTVIMNLDRYYRKKHGQALVAVINVDAGRRTEFFSPVKSAFDYFMQFHSDRFKIDPKTLKLVHLGGKDLPSFSLKDGPSKDLHYQDVQNVLDAFNNTSVRALEDLQINGKVLLRNSVLEGRVYVTNETAGVFDIQQIKDRLPKTPDGRALLKDVEIRWTDKGVVVRVSSSGVAYARVGVSGSHTDYNNGWTLAALLPVKTTTQIRPRADNTISVKSAGKQISYQLGQETLARDWGDYLKGITTILRQDGLQISGADIEISSDIPMGAGISSSAALVTSVLKAMRTTFSLKIDDLEIAKMGQRVEHFLGARTGLLDQMTISLLDQDSRSALLINFKDMSYKKVKLPGDAEFVIVHSGLTHSLTDTEGTRNYATRRNQCEGVCEKLGIPDLSSITLEQLDRRKHELDPVHYQRARHVVTENDRVKRFMKASDEGDLAAMGKIMSESHRSQRDDYDISEAPIDALVSLLEAQPGVFGAQLTGGGFGGAVVFLAKKGEGVAIAKKVMPLYLAHPYNRGQFKPQVIAP